MTYKEQRAFIDRIAPAAQASQAAHGIRASVTIAQAILESGWGKSAPGNNFFGIKKGAASAPYVECRTIEVVDGKPVAQTAKFRAFDSIEQSFVEHGRLLSSDERYRRAMADADNPIVFALRLRQCGYSTDPKYDDKLVKLIADFKLTKFDSLTRGRAG